MKTYDDLLAKLEKIGFRDISSYYYCRAATLLHLGFGPVDEFYPWPRLQLRVFTVQERHGPTIYFQDWLAITDQPLRRVESLEQIWAAAMRIAERDVAASLLMEVV